MEVAGKSMTPRSEMKRNGNEAKQGARMPRGKK
jgi:hypothetical protein